MGFRVKVYKENFDFSAGHFITFGGRCETIHGHNYRVEVSLEGENGPDFFLYNFSELKPIVRQACQALDHKMLLARDNPHLRYQTVGEEIEVRFGERRYIFPLAEVALLPLENTTAEQLAYYLVGVIRQRVRELNLPETARLNRIEVGVEEAPGQAAFYFEQF